LQVRACVIIRRAHACAHLLVASLLPRAEVAPAQWHARAAGADGIRMHALARVCCCCIAAHQLVPSC
jgi:hypothetical protein